MAGKRPRTRNLKLTTTPAPKKVKVEGATSATPPVVEINDDEWSNRAIAPGCVVDLAWLREKKETVLLPIIAANGWESLISESIEVYPELVRVFYRNMTVNEQFDVFSKVKGRPYAFNPTVLSEVLDVPNLGDAPYADDDMTEEETTDLEDFIKSLTGLQEVNALTLQHSDLDPQTKIIAEFVKRVLLPRGPKRGSSNSKECMMICLLSRGTQVNFPLLMIKHMAFVRQDKAHYLPYGPQLTKFFKWTCADISVYSSDGELQKSFDLTVLKKMFMSLENGKYSYTGRKADGDGVKRALKLVEESGESSDDGEDAEESEVVALLREGVEVLKEQCNSISMQLSSILLQLRTQGEIGRAHV
jgi:hypothetical protein